MDPIAWLHHDWTGGGTLMAYPPEPAAVQRGGNALHDRFWGLETRAPQTPCVAVWRDIAQHTVDDRKLGWPSRIMVFALFGTEPWVPPPSLIEEAMEHQRRETGHLRLGWRWDAAAASYAVESFELTLSRGAERPSFRTVHTADEVAALDLVIEPLPRPASAAAPLPFRAAGHLRARAAAGKPLTGEAVRFSIMGTAPVQPAWMLY